MNLKFGYLEFWLFVKNILYATTLMLICGPGLYDSLLPTGISDFLIDELRKHYNHHHADCPPIAEQVDQFSPTHSLLSSSSLAMSQVCSSTLVLEYIQQHCVLGTPIYDIEGISGPYCRSVLITQINNTIPNLEDFRIKSSDKKLILAVNSFNSCSGWYSLLAALSEQSLCSSNISKIIQSGSHVGSIHLVRESTADIAAIDHVSYALVKRDYPELLVNIRVIGYSPYTLSPPFVASSTHSPTVIESLQDSLDCVLNSPCNLSIQKSMCLAGVTTKKFNIDDYKESVQSLVQKSKENFTKLVDSLYFDRFPTHVPDNCSVNVDDHSIQIESKARNDDKDWPNSDSQMIRSLYNQLMKHIMECTSAIDKSWTKETLKNALKDEVIGKVIWFRMESGGYGKIIWCSLEGICLIAMQTSCDYSEQLQRLSKEIVKDLNVNDSQENPICFSAFMGASSVLMTAEPRDPCQPSNASLLADLWAADLALSDKLIELSVAGDIGVFAYISAPRHNDRHDWSNLVLARDVRSLTAWRDQVSHLSVHRLLAPYCYENIRLHRGHLRHTETTKVKLLQTVFLQQQMRNENSVSQRSKASTHLDEEFKTLLKTHPEVYVATHCTRNEKTISSAEMRCSFTRKVVAWSEDSSLNYEFAEEFKQLARLQLI